MNDPATNRAPFSEDHHILDRFRLDGRVALVTGGAQGLGRGYATSLAQAGASVMIADINGEDAERTATQMVEQGLDVAAVRSDVTDASEIDEMLAATLERFRGLHIAVNNAGINFNSAAEETAIEEWDATFGLNLRGLFLCCQAEGRHMIAQRYGKIINVASMSSLLVPHPQKQAVYNTSKAGVAHLSSSLAAEWAPYGVR